MIPAFTEAGNAVSSYDVIKAYDNTIILKDAPEVLKYFEERGFLATHSGLGFILVFQSDCTEEERQAVLNFLEDMICLSRMQIRLEQIHRRLLRKHCVK